MFGTVPLVQSFANTLFVTVLSLLLMLIIGSMAAYGMIIGNTRFNRWFGAALVLGFIIPTQSTLIPLYRLLVQIGLIDTLTGLVFLYSAGSIFCYFLIQGYMKSVPYELIEAARIDGANAFSIYWRIVLPLIRPILVTVASFRPCGSGTTSSHPTCSWSRRRRAPWCCRCTSPSASSPPTGPRS